MPHKCCHLTGMLTLCIFVVWPGCAQTLIATSMELQPLVLIYIMILTARFLKTIHEKVVNAFVNIYCLKDSSEH